MSGDNSLAIESPTPNMIRFETMQLNGAKVLACPHGFPLSRSIFDLRAQWQMLLGPGEGGGIDTGQGKVMSWLSW